MGLKDFKIKQDFKIQLFSLYQKKDNFLILLSPLHPQLQSNICL